MISTETKMSLPDLEDYRNNYKTMAQKGSTSGKWKSRRNGKRSHAFVTKTLYDPSNTLSKREQRRVLADRSDGFCPDVPYSMNKQERWSKVTVSSLLKDQEPSSPERLIVNRTDVPSTASCRVGTISNVKVIDDGVIATVSAGGKRKPLSYFNGQLRERMNLDKEEPDPARVHFNIITPTLSTSCSTKKSKQTNRRGVRIDVDEYSDYENNDHVNETIEEHNGCDSDKNSRKITLEDFLTSKRSAPLKKPRVNTPNTDDDFSKKQLLPAPATLVEIGEAVTAPHVFEVVEIDIKQMKDFNLGKEMLEFVPPCFETTWIDPCRVAIAGTLSSKTELRVIFEEDRCHSILRIRVNTDSHHASPTLREYFLHVIKDRYREYFPVLFPDIVKFISEETKRGNEESEKQTSRFAIFNEGYKAGANSKIIAPLAMRCNERDQLDYLHQFYAPDISDSNLEACRDEKSYIKCCCCRLTNKTDLFPTHDGMMCRECVASFITSQLRLNQFPVEIPIVTAPGTSPLELLYAILPLPVVSLLLKKSFAFFKCLDYPCMVFVQCPHCLARLAVTETCDVNCCSCTCSVCGCAWCYLCNWEPHWPMNCEQFKRWSERWDTQYLFDKDYFNSEKELRMCCDCETVFEIPVDSTFSFRCPNHRCRWNYTEDGQYGHWHNYDPPLSPRMWQHIRALAVDMKYCDECGVRTTGVLKAKRLIRKDVASICVEARNQRFEIPNRREFESNASKLFPLKAEQNKVIDLRNTVLYLTENCTAWLYLMGPNEHQHLKKAVSQLYRKLLGMQQEITWASRDKVVMKVKELEEATTELISMFHQHSVTV
ncbi:hypothetical protein Y032_0033g2676 [Ancylostoma ceylanicum]|uniref:IBR domain-containing protein n=1 Tax=Ancylostoma ceylanicum TaxID=53326 RepID=A0A016UM50_9BILA|nr:hypothetical protein Y032_0033g2676 [Ancylostoma ceylanicum]